MRANLLATVATAAVATILAVGSVQAQSEEELKRRPNAETTETQPMQDQGAAETSRGAATEAQSDQGEMKKRPKAASAADEQGATSSETDSGAAPSADEQRKRKAASTAETDDGTMKKRRDASTADTDDGTVKKRRDASTAETDDDNTMKRRRDASTADTDDGTVKKRRDASTAETDDDNTMKKRRNARSDDDDDDGGRQRDQASGGRSGDVEVTGSINIDRDKAARVHDRLFRSGPRTDIDISVRIGTRLPDRVVLRPVPEEIIEISPAFRGYEYTIVHEEIIIVEPRTKKVVEIIHKGGGKSASARSGRSTLKLSAIQRERIRTIVREQRITRLDLDVDLGEDVPEDVELVALPEVVFSDIPELREYEYFVTNEEIVLVEPETREVVEVIR